MRKDMNMAEHHERFQVIAAFADGERVDTQELRAALADETGRDYLIDLVAMREIVGQTVGQKDGDDRASSPSGPVRAPWHRSKAVTGLAAAVAVAVGLAGYGIGQQRAQVVSVAVRPPLEADVIVAVEAPPAPTQVIRLGHGVPGDGGR
jgi:hypothetical protein